MRNLANHIFLYNFFESVIGDSSDGLMVKFVYHPELQYFFELNALCFSPFFWLTDYNTVNDYYHKKILQYKIFFGSNIVL